MGNLKFILAFALFITVGSIKANSFKVSTLNDLLEPNLFCQQISGVITDCSTGEPIVGASIYASSSVATQTNEFGSYSLCVPLVFKEIFITYIGYQKIKVNINGRTVIDECLTPEDVM